MMATVPTILILGVSKRDAATFAAQHHIAVFEWASPRSEARVRGKSFTAIYATDKVRLDPGFDELLASAELGRLH